MGKSSLAEETNTRRVGKGLQLRGEQTFNPPFSLEPTNAVLYLIQMEGNTPVPSLGTSDILCVTWKQKIDTCSFVPGSSWTQGRNYLWKKAVDMTKKYAYYVFMDEDISLSNITQFEGSLLKYMPAIGVPRGIAQLYETRDKQLQGQEAVILHSFDAAFNAFHYDVMHASPLLPYADLFDSFSWWVSQLFTIYVSQILYPNQVMGFMAVTSSNSQHRPYPRGWNMTATNDFFLTHIIPDTNLRHLWKGYSWTSPGIAQPKPKGQRYLLADAIFSIVNRSTPYWRRVNEIRQSKDGMPPAMNDGPSIQGPDSGKKMFGFK